MSQGFMVLNGIMVISLISLLLMQIKSYMKINKAHDAKSHKALYIIPNSGATRFLSLLFPSIVILNFAMNIISGEKDLYRLIFSGFIFLYSLFIFITLDMNLVITENGIGMKPRFLNIYTQFIVWEDIVQWSWNKYNKDVLSLQFKAKGAPSGLERKITSDKEKINKLLNKYAAHKFKMSK
ncbi:hypothetical protein KQI89_10350 [Clostridium sp. MSJ-4]|uniref:DUF5673 domain-containing protein n=1 Tax=Clostridium simiarum TaxID=2841506 RepID=A0ABS6F0Y6_9CLOT|nr:MULTISPECIES: hypothetical protein [Clostridium]MBU5592161.1 hypothetical protein [Clostridium simiarum]